MKIIEIEKDEKNDLEMYPDGYRIIEQGCRCCETDCGYSSIEPSDLMLYQTWLEEQLSLVDKLKCKLINSSNRSKDIKQQEK